MSHKLPNGKLLGKFPIFKHFQVLSFLKSFKAHLVFRCTNCFIRLRSTWTDPDSWMIPKTLGDYPWNEPYRPVLITLITLIFGSSRSELLIFRRHLPHRIISSIFRYHIFSAFLLRNPKFGCSYGDGAHTLPFSPHSLEAVSYMKRSILRLRGRTRGQGETRGDKGRQGETRRDKRRQEETKRKKESILKTPSRKAPVEGAELEP